MEGKIPVVRFCKVVSIDDDTDADRIKVRLSPEDNSRSDDELDYAFPLLPKAFHIKPKVGEAVLVITAVANDGNSQRYYIGPVISQDHRLYSDPYFGGADSFLRGSYKKLDPAPRMDPEQDGILPGDNDVMIRGRKNADLRITDDDARLEAGVKVVDGQDEYRMSFNKTNPSYMKVKYHETPLSDNTHSTAAIVADKICLLSNTSPEYYNTTDRNSLVSDDELNKVIESAYRLPYGEKLVEFLKVFVDAFMKHTHNFSMLPPNPYWTETLASEKAALLDNGQMLSNTARIN